MRVHLLSTRKLVLASLVVFILLAVTLFMQNDYLTSIISNGARKPYSLLRVHHNSTPDAADHMKVRCEFPDVDPFDPEIVKLAGVGQPTLRCDDDFKTEITYVDGLNIRVNSSLVGDNTALDFCHYRTIVRPAFKDNEYTFSDWSAPFNNSIALSPDDEFLHVECKARDIIVSKAFYSLVPLRPHLNGLYNAKLKKRKIKFQPKETLNLIIVALDGLPRHQMLRGMPKTYKYLTTVLNSFDFTMHSQVQDNTYPNFLAFLSGLNIREVFKWWNSRDPEDVFEFMWHDFERAGFRTMYSEDYPRGAGFYWGKPPRSFTYQQTSYSNRPLQLAMLDEKDFLRRKAACAGPRPISEYQLEYLTRFIDTFPGSDTPVACGTFIINLTHDDTTRASLIDEHILKFYKNLEAKGRLKNSMVVFMSDHGQRWGKIRQTRNGILESRNPFLMLTLPKWFLEKYPNIAMNLKNNTKRLTTHYDTHQTLLDLMYFKSPEPTPIYRGTNGISLFNEIPKERTCEDALIPDSECLCGKDVKEYISTNSNLALKLAQGLVDAVKEKGDTEKCEAYVLKKVIQVGVLITPASRQKERETHQSYSVRLTVSPGGAMFEGKVHLNKKENRISVSGHIERLNMYKGEVECRPTSREQMYCYCKANKKS